VTDNEMCNEPYTRPLRLFPSDDLVVPVRCSFIKDHGANHSWYALMVADETELEKLDAERRAARDLGAAGSHEGSDLPPEILQLTFEIENGEHDDYIEILLAYLHDRKRCRRGVKGFPRPRRSA